MRGGTYHAREFKMYEVSVWGCRIRGNFFPVDFMGGNDQHILLEYSQVWGTILWILPAKLIVLDNGLGDILTFSG